MSNATPTSLEGAVLPKGKASFAERSQNVVMAMLVVSLLCTAQGFSLLVSQIGIMLLGVSVPLQIAVSNVDPKSGRKGTIRKSIIILLIIAAIFVFSIWITPILVGLGP